MCAVAVLADKMARYNSYSCQRDLPVEAERVNAIENTLNDLDQRALELRRYL
jgi:hypothetical protein